MDRSALVITLALVTMLLVMAWAWYSKRRAQSAPHYFGERDKNATSDTGDTPATQAMEDGEHPDKR